MRSPDRPRVGARGARVGKGLQAEIWNAEGDSKIITAANVGELEGDALEKFLHPPKKK